MRDSQDKLGVIAKPPTIYSAAVVVALVLQFVAPLPITLAPVCLWIGLSVIVLGGVLVSFALREFRNCETSEDTNVPTTTIVISGPYRFSRNPMYVSADADVAGRWFDCQCLVDSGNGRAGASGDACGRDFV